MDFEFKEIYDIFSLKTPCYIISNDKLEYNINNIYKAFKQEWGNNISLGYSIKTNNFKWLIKKAYNIDMLAEVVSELEFDTALENGFDYGQIILNGPNKSKKNIEDLMNNGGIINIDNFTDIDVICKKFRNDKYIKCKIGIRVNFDIELKCKNETTSGNYGSRFGICLENGEFERALKKLKNVGIKISGIHMHCSTKTRSLNVFENIALCAKYIIQKYNLNDLEFIDIGGGFFGGQKNSNYPTMIEYAETICSQLLKVIDPNKVELILEPGASILATCVEYISKVIDIKYVRGNTMVTLDGSLLDINPFMVKRKNKLKIIKNKISNNLEKKQILCGSTCIENDRFDVIEDGCKIDINDRIILYNVGAYTMSFNNFFINMPPNIYVLDKDKITLVR